MKTIKNKTNRPLRVPLPRGKFVHLGPAKSGQVTTEAAEYAGLKKLVEAGDIEIMSDEDAGGGAGPTGGGGARHGREGGGAGGAMRRSGDR